VIIVVIVLLLVWWWLSRRSQQVTPAATVETPTPASEAVPPGPDDLMRIEGIGPKISGLLKDAGITTFAQVADADASLIDRIIDEVGITMIDPSTWPEQASLAAAGEWDTLQTLQDELKGGRRG
jgi:predicted flap endonuclease-1-like 5' DNA nuclease